MGPKTDARRRGARALLFLLALLLLQGAALPNPAAHAPSYGQAGHDGAEEEPKSWLLKWSDPSKETELSGTQVLHRQLETAVMVVRPEPGSDVELWLNRLRELPGVEYVHPNGRVRMLSAAAPNDPDLPKQRYLDQIDAKNAWEIAHDHTGITIALVDTGIDMEHPDLKGNLVSGTNLVRPGRSPQDDNGHGTSVAGVLAAVGNNGEGVSGILWNAKLMPVKALDADGFGDEQRLGEGILYAVRNGAKIVLLSVGLYRNSPYMRDIAEYAESKGVLLVAATGNDGLKYGSKAAVKYPAGYPSVLAVGGATADNKPEPRSNPGSEVDIVAPWNVYTTALGGGYKKEEGTSMAAPQAAAVAALIWAKYPSLKPFQIRALIRQSAKDIGGKGWDSATGYGLLQADKALTADYKPDAAEPNDSRAAAYHFPLHTRLSGQLATGKDKDWFVIDIPFDGTLSMKFQGLTSPGKPLPPVRMTHYAGSRTRGTQDMKIGNKTVDWEVSKGKNYIELQFDDTKHSGVLPYLLTADFQIAPDAYEVNDKNYEAYTLTPNSQSVTGNFHQTGDRDWFAVTFKQGGKLHLKLETDSVRIDPGLAIGKAGEQILEIDKRGDGATELTDESSPITITPGKYFIRVHNASASEASPVVATYKLTLDYLTVYDDPNEPNDKSYEATAVRADTEYVGVIDKAKDEDWFQLRLTQESIVSMRLNDIPGQVTMTMHSFDKTQKSLFKVTSVNGKTSLVTNRKLSQGNYYVKVTASKPFHHQYYRFQANVDPLISGFRDISGHWAKQAISGLADQGVVSGYGEYRFEPGRGITRAEAVTILIRAFGEPGSGTAAVFKDVSDSHWAYGSIAKAVKAGWVNGYPNNTFAPDRLIIRAEMSAMFGAAMGLKGVSPDQPPFADVKVDHWAAPMLMKLKHSGWITGYPGNKFQPQQTASRAEFSALIYRALK
ncbi:hypothetical protein GCM10010916_06370 [Paenibacillus abyssi]|uniref:SLH domain-containing protein n=2 Tax=Paenibacillus abyssi TaxID=1340531 RepID=A0A917FMM0_9BACL|nr:hypothetical protein GCM10010916_06370 [Paenibacillus abyssi]